MYVISQDKCKKCKICVKNCPIGAITAVDSPEKKIEIQDSCVECRVCVRVCPFGAITEISPTDGAVQCGHCSIGCQIPVGSTGASL